MPLKRYFKIFILFIVLFSGLFAFLFFEFQPSAQTAQAAGDYHYVRAGAAGLNNGSDWTNAWTSLPAVLVRGDIYYIADGTYGAYVFNDAVSGELYITIKKAIESDHGTDAGWNSSYGDGQAAFTASSGDIWEFRSSYYAINGQFGELDQTFGIRAYVSSGNVKVVRISPGVNHINMSYLDLQHKGYSYNSTEGNGADVLYMVDIGRTNPIEDIYFYKVWLHDVNRVHVYAYNIAGCVWNNCWFTERYNEDVFAVHGESFTIFNSVNQNKRNVIKNSVFRNVEGTGIIVFQDMAPAADNYNWDIYNNIFYRDGARVNDGWTAGNAPTIDDFDTTDGQIADTGSNNYNFNIYGNTFFNTLGRGFDFYGENNASGQPSIYQNISVHNNLIVNHVGSFEIEGTDVSNNFITNDPAVFSDYLNMKFTLSRPTNEGMTLLSPYNIDMLGNTRGSDGVWDIGAYEYISASVPEPEPEPEPDTTPPSAPLGVVAN